MKKWWPLFLVLLLIVCALLIPTSRHWMQHNVGRWHIVLLHFPIGLLIMAWGLDLARLKGWKGITPEAVRLCLGAGAIGAVLAATTGWTLHLGGGYDEQLVFWHNWLGIATALLSSLLFALHGRLTEKRFFILLSLLTVLLTITGHLGGSLTHGEDFLTSELSNTSDPALAHLNTVGYSDAIVWTDVIDPILDQKCRSCHNGSKLKGGLLMDDSLSMAKGGDSGDVFGAESIFCSYLHLAEEDDLHMPPSGKLQLTNEERELLCWWVEAGTPYTIPLAEMTHTEEREALFRKKFTPPDPINLLGIAFVSPQLIGSLREQGFRLSQEDPAFPWIHVNLSDRSQIEPGEYEALDDIQDQITHLDLGNSPLSDKLMRWIGACAQLKSLKLDQCSLPDNSLKHLSGLDYLEDVNLYGATIGEEDKSTLADFKDLDRLFLWNSSLEDDELEIIRESLPQTAVVANDPVNDMPVQQMVPPHFSNSSPFAELGEKLPLKCRYPTAQIHYTTDGSEPTKHSRILNESSIFDGSCRIKARAISEGWEDSEVVEKTLVETRADHFRVVNLNAPDEKYPGQGATGLVDQHTAEALISDKQWMGYWGRDLTAVIDLGKERDVKGVAVHALEDVKSWILYPKKVRIESSLTPNGFSPVIDASVERTKNIQGARMDMLHVSAATRARYLRITVTAYGKLPEWHDSAGQDAWLFVDEIAVF